MRKPSYADVMATVAVFLAMGGGAIAAVAVTGADVKNGTLSGKDVRDRSLTARDLRPGSLSAAPAGPAGPEGPAGSQGERGPSNAVFRAAPRAELTQTFTEVVRLNLDPGRWLITGSGLLDNQSGAAVPRGANCAIQTQSPSGTVGSTGLMSVGPDEAGAPRSDTEQFSITAPAVTTQRGFARIVCERAGGSSLFVVNPAISAIQVGALDTEEGD